MYNVYIYKYVIIHTYMYIYISTGSSHETASKKHPHVLFFHKTTPKAMEISRQEEELGSRGFCFRKQPTDGGSHGTVGGGISTQDEGGIKRNGTHFGGIKQAANVLKVQFLSIFQGVGQGSLNYSSNICKSMII